MSNITYGIKILSMSAYPEYAGQKDVVFDILWSLNGTDGVYSAKHISKTQVEYQANQPFIEYNLLRPWLVEQWLNEKLGDEYFEAARLYVAKQIADQITPQIEVKQLPWEL